MHCLQRSCAGLLPLLLSHGAWIIIIQCWSATGLRRFPHAEDSCSPATIHSQHFKWARCPTVFRPIRDQSRFGEAQGARQGQGFSVATLLLASFPAIFCQRILIRTPLNRRLDCDVSTGVCTVEANHAALRLGGCVRHAVASPRKASSAQQQTKNTMMASTSGR
jgi:hypothetical protein